MDDTGRKHLYLPLESQTRELDSKVLLALTAYERGYQPFIGYKAALHHVLWSLPRGIYFAHSARQNKPGTFKAFRNFGHSIVVLDEEALVRQTDEMFLKKHDPAAFDDVTLVMTWGDDDANLWRRSGLTGTARLAATGNPRIDLLRPEFRAFHKAKIDDIRSRFGEYVLLNTNFPTVNHYLERQEGIWLAGAAADQRTIQEKNDFLVHKRAIFERFKALAPQIATAIAPTKLVIRPHPSENPQPWIDATAGMENVSVAWDGSVAPWLMGARALVHNGCTSAVESSVVGTTVLSYRPIRSDVLDNPLTNGVGVQCFDDDALLSALRSVVENGATPMSKDQTALLEHHITATTGRLSSERIVDELDRLPTPDAGNETLRWGRNLVMKLTRWGRRRIDTPDKPGRQNRRQEGRYVAHKFPDLTADAIDDRIVRFQAANPRFAGLRAEPVSRNLFRLTRDATPQTRLSR
jgi:surface carbohydrate biosynthesis protein